MEPIDYNNEELKRVVQLCEPDLRGFTRVGAKKIRADVVSPAKLAHTRTLLGLTKKDAAAFVDVSALTYASWEFGRTVPTSRFMPALIWMKIQARGVIQALEETNTLQRLYNEVNRYHPQVPGLLPRPYMPSIESIRAIRKALGMDYKAFAAACGVSSFSAHSWEKGETSPAPHAIRTMIDLLKEKIAE